MTIILHCSLRAPTLSYNLALISLLVKIQARVSSHLFLITLAHLLYQLFEGLYLPFDKTHLLLMLLNK